VIRGLLAVAPAVLVVACGVPAAQSGYADSPVRNEPVATRVAESAPPEVEPPLAVRGPAAHADEPAPRSAAQDGCNRNYIPCVPDDPVDVDCAGGSGNGPSYVTGPVQVIGEDVYGLDADHNGIACESDAAFASHVTQEPAASPVPQRPASLPTTASPPTIASRPTPPAPSTPSLAPESEQPMVETTERAPEPTSEPSASASPS
jgi:hypothetical protein